jgi:hypothetical protein
MNDALQLPSDSSYVWRDQPENRINWPTGPVDFAFLAQIKAFVISITGRVFDAGTGQLETDAASPGFADNMLFLEQFKDHDG